MLKFVCFLQIVRSDWFLHMLTRCLKMFALSAFGKTYKDVLPGGEGLCVRQVEPWKKCPWASREDPQVRHPQRFMGRIPDQDCKAIRICVLLIISKPQLQFSPTFLCLAVAKCTSVFWLGQEGIILFGTVVHSQGSWALTCKLIFLWAKSLAERASPGTELCCRYIETVSLPSEISQSWIFPPQQCAGTSPLDFRTSTRYSSLCQIVKIASFGVNAVEKSYPTFMLMLLF